MWFISVWSYTRTKGESMNSPLSQYTTLILYIYTSAFIWAPSNKNYILTRPSILTYTFVHWTLISTSLFWNCFSYDMSALMKDAWPPDVLSVSCTTQELFGSYWTFRRSSKHIWSSYLKGPVWRILFSPLTDKSNTGSFVYIVFLAPTGGEDEMREG